MSKENLFSPTKNLSTEIEPHFLTYWQDIRKKILNNRVIVIGITILFIIFIFALFAPYFTSHKYYETHLKLKNLSPSLKFWFGTDELGRDIFCRTWWGARISLTVGILAAIIDLIIGVLFGTISALIGGRTDEIMMRICDILSSIPYTLTVILLMVVLGPGLITIIIALSITGWINMARILRSHILQIKELDFIKAAYVLGASKSRIIFRHLIPNSLGPILVTMTLTIPSAMFTEAFLSFLGLGVQAPKASWGVMINDSLAALRYYPWRLFFPAIIMTFTMIGFNLLGDGLRDILDPKLRR